MRLYSVHAPITGSSRELGSTPRGGFPSNRLDGTQVMSMRLKKVCPQCDATLHARKLACPCGHVFPAKAQQTKRKRADRAIMCAKQLKEHVKQVKKLVQMHTVVLCVGPFLCRFSIDRDSVFTC